jgi:phage terminase Nu1 subunit (DNA packaging protein)
MALLAKWFPDMEDFETTLCKCRKALNYLKADNDELAEKAAAAKSGRIETELEIGTLQSNLRRLRRFVDFIPAYMKRQIRQMQRERHRDERLK